ncbi:MAG: NADH:ubiquinone reductase (Na(+)-transporting) subunit D [Caldicoprobacterales bacterium]|jgi:Na+-transporting NADH:ubiquinone oxidoreductase subunit D|nr:NADH:ubiquinone reductase (Na(+)-transporting) subunit D [Clostridiales bacterium]
MKSQYREIAKQTLWTDNPVIRQILGICSALAVTNLVSNTLVMGIGVSLVTAFSSLTVSALRKIMPNRVRMMVQTLIIAFYVILVDIILRAFFPDMSRALGPYVGLIITNCIIMGRCEAFAQTNKPLISFYDGFMSGLGYTLVLATIAIVRELMGFGTILGIQILGEWWTPWTVMVMAPSAFFVLAIIIWVANSITDKKLHAAGKPVNKGVQASGN